MNQTDDKLEKLKYLAKPFFYGGSNNIGVLLIHGLTASPSEMLPLGKFLHKKGFTTHGVCLAGHGTKYTDLPKYSWRDWFQSVEEGFDTVKEHCPQVVPIGISTGALLALELTTKKSNEIIPKLVLLAPAFDLKSKLAKLTRFLKYIRKYHYKGNRVLQYYKDHNLYAYYYYPTLSVFEFQKLSQYIKKKPMNISIPTLIAYGALDNTISIPALNQAIEQKFIERNLIIKEIFRNSAHNFTTEPDAPQLFNRIYEFLIG